MRYLFTTILIIASLFPFTNALAQADIAMTTHWYNRTDYNPAFIARTEYLYIFSNYRQQWIGVEGAPSVFTIQASEYVHSIKSAFGLSFISDKIGATLVFNPMLTYAYLIKGDGDYSLSMGLSGGVFQRSVDGSQFEADNINDPSIQYNSEKTTSPDANVGVELSTSRFIFGLSSTHLFSLGKADNSFLNTNHRYAYAIYKNNNLDEFYYKIGLQVVNRQNLSVIEANVLIRLKHSTGLMKGPREIFDFGFSVRSSRQLSLLVGMLLKPDLRFGYAYDHSFIKGYSLNSTHEIMLEYRIPTKASSSRRCGT